MLPLMRKSPFENFDPMPSRHRARDIFLKGEKQNAIQQKKLIQKRLASHGLKLLNKCINGLFLVAIGTLFVS